MEGEGEGRRRSRTLSAEEEESEGGGRKSLCFGAYFGYRRCRRCLVRPRPSHGALARSFPVGNPVAVALSGRPPHRGLAAQNGKRKWSWEADTGSRGPVRQDIRSSGLVEEGLIAIVQILQD